MQKYYPQTLNMQIPQEMPYVRLPVDNIDEKIEKLSESYNIEKRQKVKEFVNNNPKLIQYLDKITPIINNYFPHNLKTLTFCEDPEFEELNDITIYIHTTESEYPADWKKYDELETEILTRNDFSTKIKQLVSISLWFL
jgi:hypothetical protein